MNFIEDVVERFPFSQEALIEIDAEGRRRVHHFSELFARSLGLSGALAARGVNRGDVVMTLIGNRPEWVISMLACFRMGAVALPCNPQLRRKDLEHRIGVANPKLAIGEARYLGELPDGVPYFDLDDLERIFDEDLPQETPASAARLAPRDPALIVFTSGTTGEPRAALHSQSYLAGQSLQARHWLGARPGDTVWCTAATGWSKSSRNSFIAPWLCGAKALLHDGRFDPEQRLDMIEREGVNVLCQAPTEYRMLRSRARLRPLPGLRRMVSAGEALNPEVISEFREVTGLRIGDGYGQTETGAVTGVRPDDPAQGRDGTMGRPLPGIEVRVGDRVITESTGDCGQELEGELHLRVETSPTFFSGYLDGETPRGEWWATGDLVRRDRDGFLYHQGRDDDIISSSGYRIGPVEVESALISHPAVAEAAAVAAPDPERGEVVRAVVVLRDPELRALAGSGGSEDPRLRSLSSELQDHCKAVTAPYKFPRVVEFTEELPKTASGKIRRAQLRRAD